MNIKEFKTGDIITRNEPMIYKNSGEADGSYTGDRLILKGHDERSKIIFIERTGKWYDGNIIDLSYARYNWDEGWEYYPENLWQKIKKSLRNKK